MVDRGWAWGAGVGLAYVLGSICLGADWDAELAELRGSESGALRRVGGAGWYWAGFRCACVGLRCACVNNLFPVSNVNVFRFLLPSSSSAACCRCEVGVPRCWGAALPPSRDGRSLDSARSRTLPSIAERCCSTGPRAHRLPLGRARAGRCCCTRIARRHRPLRMRPALWTSSCPAASAD